MLQLAFTDKYQLWGELIHPRADRVFVPTALEIRLGETVAVELLLGGASTNVVLSGSVVGLRPKSDRFGQGLFVRFEPKELEKCRALLGLLPFSPNSEKGRRTARVDCSLPLRFTVPNVPTVGEAKNLSETGLLAKVAVPLTLGQRVTVRLGLDDGSTLQLNTEVSWCRPELKLVGMEFIALEARAAEAINACISRLRQTAGPDLSKAIVVADDEPATLALMTAGLRQAGYQVHPATRGDEALLLVRRLKPRLIILDVLLPAIDGKDLCRRFRGDAEMVTSQVILASALERAQLHAVAQDAGASDYVTKPIQMEELLELVRRYAGKP